jgi:hypothetical protein
MCVPRGNSPAERHSAQHLPRCAWRSLVESLSRSGGMRVPLQNAKHDRGSFRVSPCPIGVSQRNRIVAPRGAEARRTLKASGARFARATDSPFEKGGARVDSVVAIRASAHEGASPEPRGGCTRAPRGAGSHRAPTGWRRRRSDSGMCSRAARGGGRAPRAPTSGVRRCDGWLGVWSDRLARVTRVSFGETAARAASEEPVG